jgi:hypothetical protein
MLVLGLPARIIVVVQLPFAHDCGIGVMMTVVFEFRVWCVV